MCFVFKQDLQDYIHVEGINLTWHLVVCNIAHPLSTNQQISVYLAKSNYSVPRKI